MKYLITLAVSIQFLLCMQLHAQSKVKFDKEPAWTSKITIDLNNKKLESEAEDGYMDMAYEKQVSLSRQAKFYRRTLKILSEAGVQNGSEISVSFDPAYQQLTFHSINIIREGKTIEKLHAAPFKVIQQEKDLNLHMYDGSLTALMVLEDVRKGDLITYSYTLAGFNPIFQNKYSDQYDLRFGVPIPNIYYRLMVPQGRNIYIKNHLTNLQAAVTKSGNETVYEWQAKDITPLRLETRTPGWYDPYESVMVSEFASWADVSKWAVTLFDKRTPLSAELLKKVASIKAANATDEQRTLAALHFVQDDIRYMGIEMGINSHKPSNPNKIFNQRFGDCKDKSYLLVMMLQAMDIAANPVLINTVTGKTLSDKTPAATAFDHCTVQATVGGKQYWFDPTTSFQQGNIDQIAYPNYYSGLVINEATTNLSTIPFHEQGETNIREIFDITDFKGTARMKVITVRTGFFADDARSDFNNNSLYEMKIKYKDFYAAYFDKIVADSLTYSNDDKTGTFTSTEYYTISDIWKTEGVQKKLPFSSYVINSVMTKPSDKTRTMPFLLIYPAKYKEVIEVNMPENWPVTEYSSKVNCAGFKLTANVSPTDGKQVIMVYEYENLKDHIMPEESAAFFTNYDEAYSATGYELTYNPTQSTVSSNSVDVTPSVGLFPTLYFLLGIVVLITYLVRSQKKNQY